MRRVDRLLLVCVFASVATSAVAGGAAPAVLAAPPGRTADARGVAHGEATPRFALQARLEPGAWREGARFAVRGRLAPEASAGELREGGGFVAIGRFAKAAQACGGEDVFADGFEDG